MLAVVHSNVLIYAYWRTHSHSSASIMWSRTDNSTQSALVNSSKVYSIVLATSPLLDVVSVGMAAARARLEVLGPAIPFAQAVDCCDCQAPTSSRTSANRLAGA